MAKINLSRLDKTTRLVVKQIIQEEYTHLLNVFEKGLNKDNISKAELTDMLKVQTDSIISRHPKMNIKFLADGSIDLRTIPKPFRDKYREMETKRREKYANGLHEKLKTTANITMDEMEKIRLRGKQIQRPFKGKFKN